MKAPAAEAVAGSPFHTCPEPGFSFAVLSPCPLPSFTTARAAPRGATARGSRCAPPRAAQLPSPQPLGFASAALLRPVSLCAERGTQPLPAPGAPLLGGGKKQNEIGPTF